VLFNPDTGETRAMRSKEEANDYRYFPDPDLLPLEVTEADKARVKATMPELPEAMKARFEMEYSLSSYDAATLTTSRAMANYFMSGVKTGVDAKQLANWIMGELSARLNAESKSIEASPINALSLAAVLKNVEEKVISNNAAKKVFEAMWFDELSFFNEDIGDDDDAYDNWPQHYLKAASKVDAVIEKLDLKQESDSGAIEAIIDEVLAANQAMVEEFKAGKEKAFNALVGQAMKASKGKANPAQVNEILKKKLTN
jgi:aspartyl-tRNA(Asn)/glutamyl-tRNA(Gln) amidotransferase subunit B